MRKVLKLPINTEANLLMSLFFIQNQSFVFLFSILVLVCPSTLKAETNSDFVKDIKPILQNYCYDCHGLKKTKGKVDLTEYKTWEDLEKNPELIEKMIDVLDKNEMPPEDNKQPSNEQLELIALSLDRAFKMQRLNEPRHQYRYVFEE